MFLKSAYYVLYIILCTVKFNITRLQGIFPPKLLFFVLQKWGFRQKAWIFPFPFCHSLPPLAACNVPQRIFYKLAVLTYRAISGTAPRYLQSFFTRLAVMSSRQRLQSSVSHRLAVPPVPLSTVGRRAFPVSGANTWNDLPSHVT